MMHNPRLDRIIVVRPIEVGGTGDDWEEKCIDNNRKRF